MIPSPFLLAERCGGFVIQGILIQSIKLYTFSYSYPSVEKKAMSQRTHFLLEFTIYHYFFLNQHKTHSLSLLQQEKTNTGVRVRAPHHRLGDSRRIFFILNKYTKMCIYLNHIHSRSPSQTRASSIQQCTKF